jgi:hypothetical protein
MTADGLSAPAPSELATIAKSRSRKDMWGAALVGAAQITLTIAWARQVTPDLQWLGGAIIEFFLTSYFAFCLLQWQWRFLTGLMLVTPALLLPPLAGMTKYQYLLDTAGFDDLFELPNLVRLYSIHGWLAAAAAVAVTGGLAFLYVRNLRRPPLGSLVLWLLPICFWGLVALKLLLPPAMAAKLPSMPPLRDDHAVLPSPVLFGNWGAFLRSAVIYADRSTTIARLRTSAKPDFGFLAGTLENPERRNVYFIVLESFMDPAAISGAVYSQDPFSPLFRQWRETSNLTVMSPVFGWRSADAEFEAYCGLPVTFEGAPVVFPQLQPAEIDCLPRKLAKLGWQTETHTISDPHIYNHGGSYPKLGFQQRYYLDSFTGDDFDAPGMPSAQQVFSAQLQHIDRLLASGQPFLTAVFGTFNHVPYRLDKAKRPYVITENANNADLLAYINSVYYASRATEDYIKAILAKDASALIVAFGDHRPILLDMVAPVDYPGTRLTRQDTPLLIIDGPRGFVPLRGHVPMYSVPEIVSNVLTHGRYCQTHRCSFADDNIERPLPDILLVGDRATGQIRNCPTSAADAQCRKAVDQANRYQAALATLLGNE